MIPYFEQPVLHLGPLSIHAFGVLLALALLLGLRLVTWRARRQDLEEATTERMTWYAVGFGFVGAHLYSVLAYFPERLGDARYVALTPAQWAVLTGAGMWWWAARAGASIPVPRSGSPGASGSG
jgi:prolipoprotein diacylglyceryltransferase